MKVWGAPFLRGSLGRPPPLMEFNKVQGGRLMGGPTGTLEGAPRAKRVPVGPPLEFKGARGIARRFLRVEGGGDAVWNRPKGGGRFEGRRSQTKKKTSLRRSERLLLWRGGGSPRQALTADLPAG